MSFRLALFELNEPALIALNTHTVNALWENMTRVLGKTRVRTLPPHLIPAALIYLGLASSGCAGTNGQLAPPRICECTRNHIYTLLAQRLYGCIHVSNWSERKQTLEHEARLFSFDAI